MPGDFDRIRYMSVQNVMNVKVISLKASDNVLECWLKLMEHEISGAPVLNDDGTFVGILSTTDILKWIFERYSTADALRKATSAEGDTSATDMESLREITSSISAVAESQVSSLLDTGRPLYSLGANDSLDRALKLMAEFGVNRLPIVKDTKVIGIITRQDIIYMLAGRSRVR